jgi:hypothetical protein
MASRKKYTLQTIHMFINCLYVALFDKVLHLLGLLVGLYVWWLLVCIIATPKKMPKCVSKML